MTLPQQLERHLGARLDQERDQAARLQAMQCPPVSALLIEHLKLRFNAQVIKQDHPQLSQLLLQQFGIDKVIAYLEQQYDQQSAEARKAHES